jgi:hypothetical protein
VAAEGPISRWLQRPRLWALVSRVNAAAMTLYLWHMAPVIVAAVALYPTGLMAQPPVGSARWWELRAAWVTLLTVLLAPMAAMLGHLDRTRRPAAPIIAAAGVRAPSLLLAGIALASFALYRFAVGGFYPDMQFPVTAIVAFAAGLLLVVIPGHRWPSDRPWPSAGPGAPRPDAGPAPTDRVTCGPTRNAAAPPCRDWAQRALRSGRAENRAGFAIPIDRAMTVAAQLRGSQPGT